MVSNDDIIMINASIKYYSNYEVFYDISPLQKAYEELFGNLKSDIRYDRNKIRLYLIENKLVEQVGSDYLSPFVLTDRGRMLKRLGSMSEFDKWEDLEDKKKENRESLSDVILDHHANIIGWERKYKKGIQITTVIISLLAFALSVKSYFDNNSKDLQLLQTQEQLKKLEKQVNQHEATMNTLLKKDKEPDSVSSKHKK